tara:strand:- start:213 stop:533 length:321 start_codon:yes stop_codon:yes gene_type:complete
MSSKLITIYWRDIPAQVTAQKGRIREKALLEARFQHAIDRAATVAGLTDTDSYIAQWNRKTFACEGNMAEAVAKEAAKIEENYPDERLEMLVKQGGVEDDGEKVIT